MILFKLVGVMVEKLKHWLKNLQHESAFKGVCFHTECPKSDIEILLISLTLGFIITSFPSQQQENMKLVVAVLKIQYNDLIF